MKKYKLIPFILVVLLIVSGCGSKADNNVNVQSNKVDLENQINENEINKTMEEELEKEQEKEEKDISQKDISKEPSNSVKEENISTENKQAKEKKFEVSKKSNQAILWITENYGKNIIFNNKVTIEKDCTVHDILKSSVEVESSYGGTFVEGIKGIKSSTKKFNSDKNDWFYFVNGIFSDVGMIDYAVRPGEVIWWDYHKWGRTAVFSSIIGCYPEPFVHGFRGSVKPTTILSSEKNKELATRVMKGLKNKGVKTVNINNPTADLIQNKKGPTIIIGQWKELSEIKWLSKFNNAYTRNGTSIHFINEELNLLDINGEVAKKLQKGAGAIVASGEGNGDNSPLWLITGTDDEGVKQAVNILVDYPEKITRFYQAAVFNNDVIRLPLQ